MSEAKSALSAWDAHAEGLSDERFRTVFDKHLLPMWVFDERSLRFLKVNQAAIELYGYTRDEFLAMTILDIRPESERSRVREFIRASEGEAGTTGIWVHRKRNGELLDARVSTHPIPGPGGEVGGMGGEHRARVATIVDMTETLASQRWRDRLNGMLEMIARGAPLKAVLEAVVLLVQEQTSGVLASVLLLNEDGRTLRTAAAPGLPIDYSDQIDGMSIGPRAGSCGTAIYTGERVIVSDVLSDERWEAFRELASKSGLRSCWSEPVRDSRGKPVGSLAVYSPTVRSPTPRELEVIASASNVVGVALQHERGQANLRDSEREFRQIVETAHEGIWRVDASFQTVFVNARLCEMLGYAPEMMLGRHIFDFMDEQARQDAEHMMARRREGHSEQHDFRFRHRDGHDVWAIVSTNPILSPTHEFVGALAMLTDVSDRRKTDDALRESERRFRELADNANVISWELDYASFRFTYVSPSAEALLGYPPHEWLEDGFWLRTAHPEDAKWVPEFCVTRAERHEHHELEYRMFAADGRTVWLHETVNVVVEEGRVTKLRGVMLDITKRKLAEQALRESDRRLDMVIRGSKLVVFTHDAELRYTWIHNPTWRSTSAEMIGKRDDELLGDTERARANMAVKRRVLETGVGERAQVPYTTPEGPRCDELIVEPMRDASGRVVGLMCAALDVSREREQARALLESEAANRALLDALPDLLYRVDELGRVVSVHAPSNPSFSKEPELRMGTIVGSTPGDPAGVQSLAAVQRLFVSGETQTYEHSIQVERLAVAADERSDRSAGATRPHRLFYDVRIVRSGARHALVLIRDVTTKREIERKYEESQSQLGFLVHSMPLGVIMLDADFRVSGWNPGAERIFGYSADEIIGQSGWMLVPAESRAYVQGVQSELLKATGGQRATNQNVRKDGRLIFCEWYNAPLFDREGNVRLLACIAEDITERMAEQQRREMMVRELDHRVKNNLAAITSLAEQTARTVVEPKEFVQVFSGRLRAMARLHGMLTRNRGQGVALHELARETMDAFFAATDRSTLDGPEVMLDARAGQALAMALHELGINASKHGALLNHTGTVRLSWRTEALSSGTPEMLKIEWTESGGPAVAQPTRRGFGSELIQGMIAHELGGKVVLSFEPTGLICTIDFPLARADVVGRTLN